ncbi:hypothetical protein HK102_006656, partial [Quaeritorhiza haematococci]
MLQIARQKMVLDHLIVENMDKQLEGGDVESVLQYGAKTLFDDDEETAEAHAIRYTDEELDKLLDRDGMVQTLEESTQDEPANTNVDGGDASNLNNSGNGKPKGIFGSFTKIWKTTTKPANVGSAEVLLDIGSSALVGQSVNDSVEGLERETSGGTGGDSNAVDDGQVDVFWEELLNKRVEAMKKQAEEALGRGARRRAKEA